MMMAAEVSRQLKSSSAATSSDGKRSYGPITRDFLGGGLGIESKELDLDLHVPAGWEKRLDLKSGNVYIQRCTSTIQKSRHPLSDSNFPPQHTKRERSSTSTLTLSLFEDTSLDLKLPSSSSSSSSNYHLNLKLPSSSSSNYQSVCTLEKVKSALDRAWRDPPKKRSSSNNINTIHQLESSSSITTTTTSTTTTTTSTSTTTGGGLMVAAACPSCLLYVLISKNNPKCPKCASIITFPPLNLMPKKPKIDLNISI